MSRNKNLNLIDYSDIELYDMIRSGSIARFPSNFWDGINALRDAKNITKYLFEKILKYTIDDIKTLPISEIFKENRLSGMVNSLFEGSSHLAILNAYPELEEWITKNKEIRDIIESERKIPRYTDEQLIEKLQTKYKELNQVPIMRQMKDPEGITYAFRFGTWEKALIEAGIIEDIYKNIDESENARQNFIKKFRLQAQRLNRLPTNKEIDEIINEGELKTYFNSYRHLLEVISAEYSREELIEILQKKKEMLGRTPNNKDMIIPKAIVFIDEFDSWEKAIKEAGV